MSTKKAAPPTPTIFLISLQNSRRFSLHDSQSFSESSALSQPHFLHLFHIFWSIAKFLNRWRWTRSLFKIPFFVRNESNGNHNFWGMASSPKLLYIWRLRRPRRRLGNKNMPAYFCNARLARLWSTGLKAKPRLKIPNSKWSTPCSPTPNWRTRKLPSFQASR